MKKLISLIILLFSVNQLYAQDLYPIFKEAFKHVNIYNYHNKTDLEERIDTSIILKKGTKKQYLKISEALLSNNFKFNNINDTLLISTNHCYYDNKFELPYMILTRSSKALLFLKKYYSNNSKYNIAYEIFDKKEYKNYYSEYENRTNAYALSIFLQDSDPKKYFENYYKIISPDHINYEKKRYLKNSSGNYPKNFYYMMYKGDVDGFRELYKNETSIVYGGYDRVIRIVIKDGKVVSPTMIWSY